MGSAHMNYDFCSLHASFAESACISFWDIKWFAFISFRPVRLMFQNECFFWIWAFQSSLIILRSLQWLVWFQLTEIYSKWIDTPGIYIFQIEFRILWQFLDWLTSFTLFHLLTLFCMNAIIRSWLNDESARKLRFVFHSAIYAYLIWNGRNRMAGFGMAGLAHFSIQLRFFNCNFWCACASVCPSWSKAVQSNWISWRIWLGFLRYFATGCVICIHRYFAESTVFYWGTESAF